MDGGNQPGIAILKACRALNPRMILLLHESKEFYDEVIPTFKSVTNDEYLLYQTTVKQCIGDYSLLDSEKAASLFWQNNRTKLPTLFSIYSVVCKLSVNSADTERSFSRLKRILSKNRLSLSQESVRQLVFLN